MTRQELIRDMKLTYEKKSFLTLKEAAEYMGVHEQTARKKLYGLTTMRTEGERGGRYFIGDIAQRIAGTGS